MKRRQMKVMCYVILTMLSAFLLGVFYLRWSLIHHGFYPVEEVMQVLGYKDESNSLDFSKYEEAGGGK